MRGDDRRYNGADSGISRNFGLSINNIDRSEFRSFSPANLRPSSEYLPPFEIVDSRNFQGASADAPEIELRRRIATDYASPAMRERGSCVESALGAFSGSLHGSASRRAEDIVTTSLKFKAVSAWLKDYLRQFETIPGFGTDLYTQGDPRAKHLISCAQQVSSKNTHLKRLLEIVECVREQLGLEPNLDVGLAAISYALALPAGAGSTIFAVSRSSGWIAHAIEQRMYGGVIRPRARYIGKS